MSVLSMNVLKDVSTKGYITDKRVCALAKTHSLLCKDSFVHFGPFYNIPDKIDIMRRENYGG